MSWTTDVVNALGARLAAAGVGTWAEDGAYAASDDRPIFVGNMPATPDRVIVITPYEVSSSATSSDRVQGFQIRARGGKDPRDVTATADDIRHELHNLRDFDLGPGRFALMWRQSHTTLGRDSSGRWETSSNFYGHTAQASAHTED